MNPKGIFSSVTDHWETPKDVLLSLYEEFQFTLDPTPIGATDGLTIPWCGERVYCNPPYSNIAPFLLKAKLDRPEVAVFLLPARTGTGWFHEYCLKANEIRFIRGRLRFSGSKNNAPFDSMVVVFK